MKNEKENEIENDKKIAHEGGKMQRRSNLPENNPYPEDLTDPLYDAWRRGYRGLELE